MQKKVTDKQQMTVQHVLLLSSKMNKEKNQKQMNKRIVVYRSILATTVFRYQMKQFQLWFCSLSNFSAFQLKSLSF